MIDLDRLLQPWIDVPPTNWNENAASALALSFADTCGLIVSWEPGDEDWIRLLGSDLVLAMINVRYPLATVSTGYAEPLRRESEIIEIIEMTDLYEDETPGFAGRAPRHRDAVLMVRRLPPRSLQCERLVLRDDMICW